MEASRRTVLLVEDEESITGPLEEALAREGFRAVVAGTASEALELAGRLRPDVVLLDVMLPDGSGFDVCRALRRDSAVPIIMLTARGDEADRVVGLELGADDYVVKPFSARELVARVRAVMRRAAVEERPADGPLTVGDVRLDPSTRRVTRAERPVELTAKEVSARFAGSCRTSRGQEVPAYRPPAARRCARTATRGHRLMYPFGTFG